jgi:hypothetical protein
VSVDVSPCATSGVDGVSTSASTHASAPRPLPSSNGVYWQKSRVLAEEVAVRALAVTGLVVVVDALVVDLRHLWRRDATLVRAGVLLTGVDLRVAPGIRVWVDAVGIGGRVAPRIRVWVDAVGIDLGVASGLTASTTGRRLTTGIGLDITRRCLLRARR